MAFSIPHEFIIGEVYLPPLLVAASLGLLASLVTARLLNRFRLSNYFFYPPLVFIGLMVVYTIIIGALLVPF
jgi:hypothetical protein